MSCSDSKCPAGGAALAPVHRTQTHSCNAWPGRAACRRCCEERCRTLLCPEFGSCNVWRRHLTARRCLWPITSSFLGSTRDTSEWEEIPFSIDFFPTYSKCNTVFQSTPSPKPLPCILLPFGVSLSRMRKEPIPFPGASSCLSASFLLIPLKNHLKNSKLFSMHFQPLPLVVLFYCDQ